MLVLVLPPVSFESLVFWWLRRVYGGRCKSCPSWLFPSVKIGGSLARNDCFGAPTCLVSSLWFSCGCAVSMGKLQNLSFLEVSKQAVMSFCVAGVSLCDIPCMSFCMAGVSLCDIPTCLIMCRKSFSWWAQYCCDVFARCVAVFVAGAAL